MWLALGTDRVVTMLRAVLPQDAGGGSLTSGGERGVKKGIAQTADEAVFDLLKSELPAGSKQQTLMIDERLAQASNHEGGIVVLSAMLSVLIRVAYPSVDYSVARKVASEAAERVKTALDGTDGSSAGVFDRDLQERLQTAFTELEYIGDAGDKFAAYLKRCWRAYQDNYEVYKAPYVAIVQSSGFGKSRLLYKLAQGVEHDDSDMKVLYTCTRFGQSTGFPVATEKLRDWLFGPNQGTDVMSKHLEAAYHYAREHWSTVGSEWIELFTSSQADELVQKRLEATETEFRSRIDRSVVDEAETKAPSDKTAQVVSSAQESSKASGGVVILVVDEARELLNRMHDGTNYFRLLRRALVRANKTIRRSRYTGGIFAVLVDTNSKVSDLTPPLWLDPSSRNDRADPA
ncbi:hypothetical protein BBJ28_00026855, partial [Nothophytophthora sp. Chile5]